MENELKKMAEFAGLISGLSQASRCAGNLKAMGVDPGANISEILTANLLAAGNLKAMGVDPGANICDILNASLLAARANVLAIEGTMKELGCDIPE